MNNQATVIEIPQSGPPEVLQPSVRAIPDPGHGEVLVEVAFAGINRPDIFQRNGNYAPPPGASDIPGLEIAGTIVAVGEEVDQWQIGDQVCALLSGGGYSTLAIADADLCLSVPRGLSLQQAAGLPETCFTVWFNLIKKAQLRPGDAILIHGGSSGIGTIAIQFAYALGATVYATAGSDEKCELCERLGATKAFNYRTEDFGSVKSLTHGGVDIILDMVGGDYVQRNIKVAAPGARIINIAFLQGSKVEIDLMPVMLKQLVLTGSTLRSQPLSQKSQIAAGVRQDMWPLVEAGQLVPVIHQVFALNHASEAHRLMESSQHMGKIILDCRS
jgi:putative PIG3 family NAD(P)H quinone oxidoreductase